ncbi:MAG: NAD(P)/FAD-dependent oxidoreductase [Ilumatobacteraceae bacterium]
MSQSARPDARPSEVDVVVVGAGFSGLYLLHRLNQLGFSARVLEAGDDVGGTWYWNRYPGARCDIPTTDYTLTFDPALETEWTWSEKYATQPEILRYAQFIATKYGLYDGIDFGTKVADATWDEQAARWRIRTDQGEAITTQYYVMATGCLSVPKDPDIEGISRFAGPTYFTSRWPHEGVDFTGKRVGVIGTGSSGIQSILADRRAGVAAHRLPAHAQLLGPGLQRCRRPRAAGSHRRRPRHLPRRSPPVERRRAETNPPPCRPSRSPTSSAAAVRGDVGQAVASTCSGASTTRW